MKLDNHGEGYSLHSGAALRVGFVLLDQFTLAAFSGFIDAIRLAADLGGRSRQIHCSWSIMGNAPVRSSSGLQVTPHGPPEHPERFDYIAVCGGNAYQDRKLLRACGGFLREAEDRGRGLIGVCTGTFALAEAGLLDGHLACIHWNVLEYFRDTYPAVKAYSDQLFIESGSRITCAGSLSSVDLALFLLRRHCGPEKAQQAARHMLLHGARPGDHPQPHLVAELDSVADPVVRRVVLLMEQSMNEFRPISWFADRAEVSVRQLERRFKQALGLTPAAMFRRLRLDYASFLLKQTDRPVLEIAVDCGFVDSAHMIRDFKNRFATTPMRFRLQSRASKIPTQNGGGH